LTNKDFQLEVLEQVCKLNDSLWYMLRNIVVIDKEILQEVLKLLNNTIKIVNEIEKRYASKDY